MFLNHSVHVRSVISSFFKQKKNQEKFRKKKKPAKFRYLELFGEKTILAYISL